MVNGRQMLGEINHPVSPIPNPAEASHLITKLTLNENGVLYGEAEILDTPKGKIVQSLLDRRVRLGISTRGAGKTIQRNGLVEVAKGYKLFTLDLVSNPSSLDAFPNAIYENEEKENFVKFSDVLNECLK
jgi:hypothetical protein